MRVYAYLALVLGLVGLLAWTHYIAYSSGQTSITQRLKDDRITILRDGKSIDEDVRNSSDDELVCRLLDNCPN